MRPSWQSCYYFAGGDRHTGSGGCQRLHLAVVIAARAEAGEHQHVQSQLMQRSDCSTLMSDAAGIPLMGVACVVDEPSP